MKRNQSVLLMLLLGAVAVLAVLRSAGDANFWRRQVAALGSGTPHIEAARVAPRILVAGGGGQAVPRATAEDEGLAPEALAAAIAQAGNEKAQMLIVQRHGHRLAEFFADGRSGDTELAGGDLSLMPLALALGSMADAGEVDPKSAREALLLLGSSRAASAWRNPWSTDARLHFALSATQIPAWLQLKSPADLISQRVWQPLGAGPGALWGEGTTLRLDCCFVARVDDWMRIGDLLLQQGQYNGERIASAGWIRELLVGDTGPYRHLLWKQGLTSWTGDEPPAARDVFWADLGPDARLWLLPQRGLAVLHASQPGSGRSKDTTLPNILIRGIVDQVVSPSSHIPLAEMVPGH